MRYGTALLIICLSFNVIMICDSYNQYLYAARTYEEAMNAANSAIKSGDWQKLQKHAEDMLRFRPDNVWANYYYGLALTNSGMLPEGEKYLLKAISIEKENFWPHIILFFNYSRQNHQSALVQAARVEKMITADKITIDSFTIKAFFSVYCTMLQNAGKMHEARNLLRRAMKFFPNDPLIIAQLGWTYFRTDMKTWEQLSRKALALVPEKDRKALQNYQIPLRGSNIKVHQGNQETISHLGILNGYHWDFVMVDEYGKYGSNENRKEGHYIFGKTIYAAADGVVDSVIDSNPDTDPMKNDPSCDANQIVIKHPNGEYSIYVHIQQGSALVKQGDNVKRGQPIAKVGASGRWVDIPHLHFGIMRNGMAVETKLTGFEIFVKGRWKKSEPVVLKKNDIIRSSEM